MARAPERVRNHPTNTRVPMTNTARITTSTVRNLLFTTGHYDALDIAPRDP